MKKVTLKLDSDSLSEIKISCENLKNCFLIKTEVLIALQRNLKTVKHLIESIQEEVDLLVENRKVEIDLSPSQLKTIDSKYQKDINSIIKQKREVELYTFSQDEFPDNLGDIEAFIQTTGGQTEKTTYNFLTAFLPLIDLLIFDS